MDTCLKQTAQRFGGIDILLSMHGAHPQPDKSDIETMDLSFWEGYINGHVTGSYVLVRCALPPSVIPHSMIALGYSRQTEDRSGKNACDPVCVHWETG